MVLKNRSATKAGRLRPRRLLLAIRTAALLLFFLPLFRFASFALRFEALFAALGPFSRAFHQVGTHQLDHGLFGAIAFAEAQAHDAGVAAGALAEAGTQRIEQLLHRRRGFEKRRSLPAGVQRIALGKRNHAIHQRLDGLGLGHGGDHALLLDHAGHQALKQGIAGTHVPLEFGSASSVSHEYPYSPGASGCSYWASSSGVISGMEPGAGAGGATSLPCASTFMPSESPMLPRISLISLSDLRPKFLVRNISASVFCTSSPMV